MLPLLLAGSAFVSQLGVRNAILATDFRAYYTAGRMVLGGVQGEFYSPTVQFAWQRAWAPEMQTPSELNPFRNPPFLAALFAPLAWLPVELAYSVWFVINLGLLCLLVSSCQSTLANCGNRSRSRVLVLSLSFLPVIVTLLLGQVSLLLAIGMLGAWRAFRDGRDGIAGVALALLLIKPQFLLLPTALLLLHRRWRTLATLVTAAVVMFAVSLAIVGWDGLGNYSQVITGTLNWQDSYAISPQRMHTWRGFLQSLARTDDPSRVQVAWLLGILAASGATFVAWRGDWNPTSERFALQWALLTVAAVFVSPYANFHDLTLLIVAGVLVARSSSSTVFTRRTRTGLATLPFLGYIAVIATQVTEPLQHVQVSVVFMFAALAACSYVVVRMRSRRCLAGAKLAPGASPIGGPTIRVASL